MMYSDMDVFGMIAAASNIRTGGNPEYTAADFLAAYPQFGTKTTGEEVVPRIVLAAWVKLAHASLHKNRYHDAWEVCMGLYIAHWLTLYLQTAAKADDPVGKTISAGLAKGLQSSKSAGDLSVSYDFGTVEGDFAGWGTYKLTAFGQQFVTMARMYGMGGMVVW
ncbi:MAG: DUF4054 domain-containing protein [Schwartzia sp. (in: firmicutes)]